MFDESEGSKLAIPLKIYSRVETKLVLHAYGLSNLIPVPLKIEATREVILIAGRKGAFRRISRDCWAGDLLYSLHLPTA